MHGEQFHQMLTFLDVTANRLKRKWRYGTYHYSIFELPPPYSSRLYCNNTGFNSAAKNLHVIPFLEKFHQLAHIGKAVAPISF